ncbi:3-oxoacyl-[acyl-carrier-protein] reductase [Anaerovirgula multivorans]|uniref:3-oxoacyl-[acyl-carrier-protein] reductase n=1 Tax=Anaerovirgula multivorans TaxID=312168 RepID=A0A239A632_9FIRM|nr:3-oxoacyl-[acyl-carrier-protein] reductase [Anaerovirgula multivorans]SNR90353.1 3-oxoacyl-[acyl-carrier-protein] reductase [Anaerovirgula multivorans]
MILENKNVIITGGSRGIGRSIALQLARNGANVIINYTSNKEAADKVVKEIEAYNVKGLAIQCDVTKSDDIKKMIETVENHFDTIDILVNNAGITKDNLLLRMKEEEWQQVIDVNLTGVFLCTKAVIRKMMKQKHGKIVNISSVVGVTGNAGQANYSASKAGVIGFTKSIAKEVASKNIHVNAIAPGFIETDMTAVLSEDIKSGLMESIPLKRYGQPDDIANLVVFLSSNQSNYITGQVINVDGGMAI